MRLGLLSRVLQRRRRSAEDRRIEVDGLTLQIPADMAWAFGPDGRYYERNVEHWLRRLCTALDRPRFYDIGANVGYYSATLAPLCREVVAFEANPRTASTLRANLSSNGLTSSSVESVALGDTEGTARLNLYSSSGNDSLHRRAIPRRHPLRSTGAIDVPLIRLDSWRESRPGSGPDLLKIDVEGSELAVLVGARRTLADARPVVLVETSEATAADAGYGRDALLEELRSAGYRLHGLSEDVDELGLIDADDPRAANVIAVPEERPPLPDAV